MLISGDIVWPGLMRFTFIIIRAERSGPRSCDWRNRANRKSVLLITGLRLFVKKRACPDAPGQRHDPGYLEPWSLLHRKQMVRLSYLRDLSNVILGELVQDKQSAATDGYQPGPHWSKHEISFDGSLIIKCRHHISNQAPTLIHPPIWPLRARVPMKLTFYASIFSMRTGTALSSGNPLIGSLVSSWVRKLTRQSSQP